MTYFFTLKKNEIPGLLVSIDYQKAFDSISWTFIESALVFFNFGNDIVNWFKTLYNDAKSNINVNGQYSSWFKIKRGVRQGDPCSPYFYLIGAEILSILLRSNPDIKGIKVRNEEYLLSQFADDTVLCLDGEESSFKATVDTLDTFSKISGLIINNDKTQIMWIGSRKNCNTKYMRDRNYTWDPGIIRILGINFSTNLDSIFEINYKNKLSQIEQLFTVWRKRNLTPFGKITIIKTLAIPKLLYLFINLPDPPENYIKRLEDMVYRFLWDSKPSKVSRQIIEQNKEDGGLDMIHIRNFLIGIKLSWLRRIRINKEFELRVLNFYPMIKNIPKMGADVVKVFKTIKGFNPFWENVIQNYEKLCNKSTPKDNSEFVSEFIFFNKNILRDHKTIYIKEWVDKGILKIGNLLDADNKFLSHDEFKNKYNLNSDFLSYRGIIEAIKSYMRKCNLNICEGNLTIGESKVWKTILRGNREIKNILNHKHTIACKAITKWNLKFDNPDWTEIFKTIHTSTLDTKLKWFAYKIIYRIIPTNRHLYLIKIKNNSLCNFCNKSEQTISHLFWSCEHITHFWQTLENHIRSTCTQVTNVGFNEELILLGQNTNSKVDQILYLIILFAKYFIFSCKIQDRVPRIDIFKPYLKFRMAIEQKSQPNHITNFDKSLDTYKNILQ